MKTLGFYGASDDLFLADVDGKCVEELCNSGADEAMAYLVKAGTESLVVVGIYAPAPVGGTWVVGVTLYAEGFALPPWPMRFISENPDGTNKLPYSPRLIIEAPDNVTIEEID